MNTDYIKDYRYKELKDYIIAYLLVVFFSVGIYTINSVDVSPALSAIFKMVAIDVWVGAICILAYIFNELWSDRAKTRIVYNELPSSTVFSKILSGEIQSEEFDIEKAKAKYAFMADAPGSSQSAEWNKLLFKSRNEGHGNVIEAERAQLLTRDMCLTTVSLFIMSVFTSILLLIIWREICVVLKMMGLPLLYLLVMFFITRVAANNRANRFTLLVIKNDVLSSQPE